MPSVNRLLKEKNTGTGENLKFGRKYGNLLSGLVVVG